MSFATVECTELLFQRLKLPAPFRVFWDGSKLIGARILYDVDSNTALISEPQHPKESGQSFQLSIDGNCFPMSAQGKLIRVHVGDNPSEVAEALIRNFALKGFEQHFPSLKGEYAVQVERRHSSPYIPRPHSEIVTRLNAVAKLAENMGHDTSLPETPGMIMLLSVRSEELESFIERGKQTAWDGLSESAQMVIRLFLAKPWDEIRHIYIR